MIRDNMGSHGSLDTDAFARALMQYRNTPLQEINLSPAQILLGRNIRDFFPLTRDNCKIRKEWLISAEDREKALARRHATHLERLSLHAHQLPALTVGDSVLIQNQVGNNPTRWDRTGVIIDIGPGPRQYYVRTDGSGRVTLRNRRFLRKCHPVAEPTFPVAITSYPDSTYKDIPAEDLTTEKQMADLEDLRSEAPPSPHPPTLTTPPAPPSDSTTHETPRKPTHEHKDSSPASPELRRSSRIRGPPTRYGDYVTH